jgi:lysyl-tRNA synthetase, class II
MSLDEIRQVKLEKIEKLKKAGIEPYPSSSERTTEIAQALLTFDTLSTDATEIVIGGRLMAKREHGGSAFFDVKDGSGKIQAYIKEDVIGKDKFQAFNEFIDIGDFIEVKGTLFKTKKEEKTLQVASYKLLTKALLPLPEKWHGLQDSEERLRLRYVDLLMNDEERQIFVKKSKFWNSVRQFLLEEGGLEVETPVLEKIPGGADAEPFKTHLNALDIDLYLRISLELNLKRLIVGGYDKVFEIGRIFRNEGIDREHLQDYTQMEMYWAYTDYKQLMRIIEGLYRKAIEETLGTLVHNYQSSEIDWGNNGNNWPELDYYEIFKEKTGLDLKEAKEKDLKKYAEQEGIDTAQHVGRGRLVDIIFKKKVRPHIIQPCFLVRPPVDIEPLAKRWAEDPDRVERFQIMAGGTELGKGFSELNDPVDQYNRFKEQVKLGEAGDKEAQRMDEDFVQALEYGMPPTAGFGMSERLFSFIFDRPVRENVFFPLMRPRE